MFEAVVFDMDGVIFDTEKLYRKYQLEEGLERGIPEEVMVKACEKIAGGNKYTNKKTFEDIVGRGIDYFEYREKMIARLDKHLREKGVDMKNGVRETLDYLKKKGIKIGLATSTVRDRAEYLLQLHGIEEYFDRIIYGDMVKNGKPNPDIYLLACESLEVSPENAIAVEDSINGIISAGRAGMYPVMVIDLIQPNDEIRQYAKQIYDNMTQLMDII